MFNAGDPVVGFNSILAPRTFVAVTLEKICKGLKVSLWEMLKDAECAL
jgi:hypothetical protein